MLAALLVGCEETRTILVPAPTSPPTTMEQVIANVHAIDDALAQYAADHDSNYPTFFNQKDWDLYDFRIVLPDSLPLENPVTGERTEPHHIDEVHPARPAGSVIYTPYSEYDDGFAWVSTGYLLSGVGPAGEIYALNRLPAGAYDRFALVRQNCAIVMAAAEAFAGDNNGIYAGNVGADINPMGKTVIDYLPEGRLLENPVILARTVPRDGAAAQWGETAYLPVDGDGDGANDGCVVDGFGTLWSEYFVLLRGAAAQ
jgi:hypothetical protein